MIKTVKNGCFRLYEVSDEPDLTGGLHLELSSGDGTWKCYLLPKGLPGNFHKKMVSTNETITKSRTSMLDCLSK